MDFEVLTPLPQTSFHLASLNSSGTIRGRDSDCGDKTEETMWE